jgi:hypothetical protein
MRTRRSNYDLLDLFDSDACTAREAWVPNCTQRPAFQQFKERSPRRYRHLYDDGGPQASAPDPHVLDSKKHKGHRYANKGGGPDPDRAHDEDVFGGKWDISRRDIEVVPPESMAHAEY